MKNFTKLLITISFLLISTSVFALANPAAVNCANKGLRYALLKDPAGNSVGICFFKHSYCEEWQFFRGECRKGQNPLPGNKFDRRHIGKYCADAAHRVVLCR